MLAGFLRAANYLHQFNMKTMYSPQTLEHLDELNQAQNTLQLSLARGDVARAAEAAKLIKIAAKDLFVELMRGPDYD